MGWWVSFNSRAFPLVFSRVKRLSYTYHLKMATTDPHSVQSAQPQPSSLTPADASQLALYKKRIELGTQLTSILDHSVSQIGAFG